MNKSLAEFANCDYLRLYEGGNFIKCDSLINLGFGIKNYPRLFLLVRDWVIISPFHNVCNTSLDWECHNISNQAIYSDLCVGKMFMYQPTFSFITPSSYSFFIYVPTYLVASETKQKKYKIDGTRSLGWYIECQRIIFLFVLWDLLRLPAIYFLVPYFFWQTWECTPGKTLAWNLLSLFTTSGLLFLEVSLIAFLLQGNYTSGTEALTRTFAISAMLVGLDVFLKVFHVPTFKEFSFTALGI